MSGRPGEPNRLEWRTPAEIASSLARDPRLLLAVSPLEDHGPGLPVGTGLAIASAVVDAASAATGILRAPPLAYGVTHGRSAETAGLASLQRKTLHRAVNELLAGWEDHGVDEFVLVTAHGSEAHLDALLMALNARSRTTVFDLGSVPLDDVLSPEAERTARDLEASLLLHLRPDRLPAERDDARYAADASSGEALFERFRTALVRHLRGEDENGDGAP